MARMVSDNSLEPFISLRMWCMTHGEMHICFANSDGKRYHFYVDTTENIATGEDVEHIEQCYGPFEKVPPPPVLTESEWAEILEWVEHLSETEVI